MDSIQDILQCKWCLMQLSDPVILPCGESVCRKHTEDLQAADWACFLCNDVHKLAEGERFPVNNMALTLLRANLSKLDFGPTYNDAKDRVKRLRSKQAELKHVIKEPENFICTQLYKYRNQVDLSMEEIKKLVDDVCLNKRKEIDEFQSKATQAVLQKTTVGLTNLDQKLDEKITNWKDSLDKLVVNEPLWKEIAEETKQYEEQLDKKLANVLETPSEIVNISKSIEKGILTKLSQRLDKNSIWIRDLSTIAKSREWPAVFSETFTIQDCSFYFYANFNFSCENLSMDLYLRRITESEPVYVSWVFNILGPKNERIKSTKHEYEFTQEKNRWGRPNLISVKDILTHPAYDANDDTIRVQVVIKD